MKNPKFNVMTFSLFNAIKKCCYISECLNTATRFFESSNSLSEPSDMKINEPLIRQAGRYMQASLQMLYRF